MTIRKKIFAFGAIIFCVFVAFALMNIRMHQKVISNLQLRDQVRQRLAVIEEFARWKNSLIRLVSESLATGHVPHFSKEVLKPPAAADLQKAEALASHAGELTRLLNEKEIKAREVEKTFDWLRLEINTLYYKLDEKISTIQAQLQMNQVMGKEAPEKSSLTPYVLKTLNQLTRIALNSLISRQYTETDESVVSRSRLFLSSQLNIIDEDGSIGYLFNLLFDRIESMRHLIPQSHQALASLEGQITEKKNFFDKTLNDTDLGLLTAAAQSQVNKADAVLKNASRQALGTAVLFLVVTPVIVIAIGLFGLNSLVMEPINKLVDAMKLFQSGHFDAEAPVRTRDEIGELAQTFNAMAAEIKSRVNDMARLNRTLKESEFKYRTLVENIPLGIFMKDRNRCYVSCNDHFARDLELTEEDIIGKKDEDLFSSDLANRYIKEDKRIFATRKIEDIEETHRVNGQKVHILKTLTPVWNEQGEISGVLGIYADVTERKRTEAERDRLVAAMNHTTDSIIITDTEGTIQYVNPSFEQSTGYTARDAIGKKPNILNSGRHTPSFYQALWQTITAGGRWQGRLINKRKNDSLFIEEAIISPVLDSDGEIMNFMAVKRDITNEIEMEKKLQQAQKMEAIGNLAGGIAHDFNNILFPILGISELLMMDLAPESPEYARVREIFKAGRRGADLVKQILVFSRQSEQKKVPTQVQRILHEALSLCRSTIPADIDIHQDIQQNCPMVQADPSQLHQVVMNIVTNAYHAVEASGGKIAIKLSEKRLWPEDLEGISLPPGRYAELGVSDTGTGIAPGILDKIFDPYFTTKEQGKGTGLGLAVVYGIIREHGGDIKVASEVGKGTTFRIFLPLMESTAAPKGPEASKANKIGTERVLLVDDEVTVADLERELLQRLGYRVTSHVCSLEALEAFKADPLAFDLVLTDMTMPHMTGAELAREILSIRSDTPIVICTGFSERIDREKAEAAGIRGFLMKPIIMTDLAEMVRNVLDEAGGWKPRLLENKTGSK